MKQKRIWECRKRKAEKHSQKTFLRHRKYERFCCVLLCAAFLPMMLELQRAYAATGFDESGGTEKTITDTYESVTENQSKDRIEKTSSEAIHPQADETECQESESQDASVPTSESAFCENEVNSEHKDTQQEEQEKAEKADTGNSDVSEKMDPPISGSTQQGDSLMKTVEGVHVFPQWQNENLTIDISLEGRIVFSDFANLQNQQDASDAEHTAENAQSSALCEEQSAASCPKEAQENQEEKTNTALWNSLESKITAPCPQDLAQFSEYAAKQGRLLAIEAVKITLSDQEAKVDFSDAKMMISIALTENFLNGAGQEEKQVSVLKKESDGTISTLASAEGAQQLLALTVSAEQSIVLAVAVTAPEPTLYKVQYYANIPQYNPPEGWADNEVPFIDTTAAANGGKPKLPQNGSEKLVFRSVYLKESPEGYVIPMTSVLQPLFTSKNYLLREYPTPQSVDILKDQHHYHLKEIWRLKQGAAQESIDPKDWDVFLPTAEFTNDPTQKDKIFVDVDTVLRFVYDTVKTEKSYENAVVFYDYDVTDGNPTPYGNGRLMLHTEHYGINDPKNYKQNGGTHFAFGNANIGTDYGNEYWNGSQLNRFNDKNKQNGGKGNRADAACFGIVKGIDANENPIYAQGLDVPNLFAAGPAIGKKEITDKSLLFNRQGDTYVLCAVKGTKTDHLNVFQDNGGWPKLWSNEFWPMDEITTGADPFLGGPNNQNYMVPAYGGGEPPLSDSPAGVPAKDHNNYFGMHCTIEFEAASDYVGPLDFFFYGDDDLWVFVDDQLIMDIGGVHCSTGMYADLWDYIPKGTSGKHRLNIFYTERGASGSACYMRFTLPNAASAVPPVYEESMFCVEKEVRGPLSREWPFTFSMELQDAKGDVLKAVPYTIYAESGIEISKGILTPESDVFQLKDGEYLKMLLPVGTKYTVRERIMPNDPPCKTMMQVDHAVPIYTRECSGVISSEPSIVHAINEADCNMPATGGGGTDGFVFGGLMLLALPFFKLKNGFKMMRQKSNALCLKNT